MKFPPLSFSSSSSTITITSTILSQDNTHAPKIWEILESHEQDIPSSSNDCCINADHTNTLIISKGRTSWSYPRDSRKFPKTTWFSGVFRGLLCRDDLPNCPSDHFKLQFQINPSSSVEHVKQLQDKQTEDKIKPSASPGVIAKLMGLESLPPNQLSDREKSHRCNLSMNSVGAIKKLDSIRENPTFLVLEDETFIILSFENGDKDMKSMMGSAEEKQRRGEKGRNRSKSKRRRESVCDKNKENHNVNCNLSKAEKLINTQKGCSHGASCDGKFKDSINILCYSNHFCKNSFGGLELKKLEKGKGFQKYEGEKGRTRIQKIRAVGFLQENRRGADCGSDNSSPNSVLDKIVFPCDPEVSSSGELSRLSKSKSRSTLTEELENYMKLLNPGDTKSLINNNSSHCKAVSTESKVIAKLRKNDCKNHGCLKLWSNIQEHAEKESTASIWIWTLRGCNFLVEEISVEIGVEIIDKLLEELVDQFIYNFHV